jgi:hypothetical protein
VVGPAVFPFGISPPALQALSIAVAVPMIVREHRDVQFGEPANNPYVGHDQGEQQPHRFKLGSFVARNKIDSVSSCMDLVRFLCISN